MIKIGCCGFSGYRPEGAWQKRYASKLQAYADAFETVEINRTFYQLPMVKTMQRWREQVGPGFDFTLKAWQAITHAASSPTWRSTAGRLTNEQLRHLGNFRPHPEVMKAWKETRRRAEALQASVCVLQTPAGFACTADNERNLRGFMEQAVAANLHLAWEPRGNWLEHSDKVRRICKDLGLIHIVDIMRRQPVSEHTVAYTRLHGLNRREIDYKYDYSDDELKELAAKLKALAGYHDTVYCMFNNTGMFVNALKLKQLL